MAKGSTPLTTDDISEYEQCSYNCFYESLSIYLANLPGLKKHNNFGLYDMLGNVQEICWDPVDPPSGSDPDYETTNNVTDPAGEENGEERVIRGGDCRSSRETMLSAQRYFIEPVNSKNTVGFRFARTVTEESDRYIIE